MATIGLMASLIKMYVVVCSTCRSWSLELEEPANRPKSIGPSLPLLKIPKESLGMHCFTHFETSLEEVWNPKMLRKLKKKFEERLAP